MSASREKKKRQEFIASGAVDPKAAREAEKKAAEKKTNILYASLAGLFVIVAVGLLVYNSGILQRSRTAVTIDGEKYTVADAAFYYQDAYQTFMSQNSSLASMMGLDTSLPLDSQYFMGSEDQTWADYFQEQAVATMKFVHAGNTAAKAEGLTLEEDDLAMLESNKEAMTQEAAMYGYTYEAYLDAIYGSLVTPSLYEQNMKEYLLATKYASNYYSSISFTDDEILAYYEENKNSYDLVDAEYVVISGSPETKTDEDGNTIEATEEEKAAAMEAASEAAESVLAAYEGGSSLESLAEDTDKATYISNNKLTYTSTVIGDWMFDEARQAGDTGIVASETSYYVVAFHGRERDESSSSYSARHILVTDANLELEDGEEATAEMLLAKAEEILASWDGTEEGFAALANEHSQDGGSNTNGGLYEDVLQGTMVTQFEGWCYEDGRQNGDTGIVETSYGQHIMFFVGYGETPYWRYACNEALVSDAYSTWQTELSGAVTAEVNESVMDSVS